MSFLKFLFPPLIFHDHKSESLVTLILFFRGPFLNSKNITSTNVFANPEPMVSLICQVVKQHIYVKQCTKSIILYLISSKTML